MGRVTLQTVADHVGVSRMTVSNAFSRPDQLSPALRQRILAAADELGYSGPDPTARALARGSTGAVGVLLTDSLEYAFVDEVATRFLGSVAAGLGRTGLALTLLTSEGGPASPARELPMDGAVVYSCVLDSPSLDSLRRRKLPLVYVDQPPGRGYPSVNIDDYGGARIAARHVLDLGHRRVATVATTGCGPFGLLTDPTALDDVYVVGERMRGWHDELTEAGVQPVMMSEPYGAEARFADRLLELPDPPTAVLCFSDAVALTVIEAARRHGLQVPRDLSVVGFDDAPMASRVTPGLTTVAQDVDGKGRAAARLLVARVEARRAGAPDDDDVEHVLLPTRLVVRASTAAPPS